MRGDRAEVLLEMEILGTEGCEGSSCGYASGLRVSEHQHRLFSRKCLVDRDHGRCANCQH
jgi:hypothetical protein